MLNSIRFRISAASVLAIVATLFAANLLIGNLFKEHATKQFEATMRSQVYQLASLVTEDPKTGSVVLSAPAGEPRWFTPLSGLYWQINFPDGKMLRSRSLWDSTLKVQAPVNLRADTFYFIQNFNDQSLLVLSKNLSLNEGATKFVLTVAADTNELQLAILDFQLSIQGYLFILALVLLAMLFLQVTFGLAPLSTLQKSLKRFHQGEADKIEGVFPVEFNALVAELNAVLERNKSIVMRAKTQAGNLAHAMKTPIAVISNALSDKTITEEALKELLREQIGRAKEQVDWNLAKARVASAARNPRLKTPVLPIVESIVSVMNKVYADKALSIEVQLQQDAPCIFNGEEQDLLEIMGNLIDNACKWAKARVLITIGMLEGAVQIVVNDDGAGILPENYSKVLRRGFRADELTQGSGLGLAIVADLVSLYDGTITLSASEGGGLRVTMQLPSPK